MSVENKVDIILQRQMEDRIVLARIETDLRHHIKRSDQHEKQLKEQQGKINKLWLAVATLIGAGVQSSGASVLKWLGGIL